MGTRRRGKGVAGGEMGHLHNQNQSPRGSPRQYKGQSSQLSPSDLHSSSQHAGLRGASGGFAGLPDYDGLDVCLAAKEALGTAASWPPRIALHRELPAAGHRADVRLPHEGARRQGNGRHAGAGGLPSLAGTLWQGVGEVGPHLRKGEIFLKLWLY